MGLERHVSIREAQFRKAGVVPVCGAVCVCVACHGVSKYVLKTCFCAVSLVGTMRSAISVLLEKTASVILMLMP